MQKEFKETRGLRLALENVSEAMTSRMLEDTPLLQNKM